MSKIKDMIYLLWIAVVSLFMLLIAIPIIMLDDILGYIYNKRI